MFIRYIPLLAVFSIISPMYVFADTTLKYSDGSQTNLLQVHGSQLKAGSEKDSSHAIIYNAKNNNITVIDHSQKTYMIMTEATMRMMGGAASAMQSQIAKQMEAQMQGLSEAERAQMKQMMEALMPKQVEPDAPPPIKTVATGQTIKVNSWQCELFEIYQGASKVSDACLTQASKLDISDTDYAVMRGFVNFAQSLAASFPSMKNNTFPGMALEGNQIPVQMENTSGVGKSGSMVLQSVSNAAVAATEFAIPADYKEQNIAQMMP